MAKASAVFGKMALKKGGRIVLYITAAAVHVVDVRAQVDAKVDVRADVRGGRGGGSGRATIHARVHGAANFGTLLENEDSRPRLVDAVKKAFGYNRKDQKDPETKRGSLRVTLHCLTDERFLEVLEDYKLRKMEESLGEEFEKAGFKVEGLNIQIENIEEVNETKEAINKRRSDPTEEIIGKTMKKTDMSTASNQDELAERVQDIRVQEPSAGDEASEVDEVKSYLELVHDLTMESYSKDGYQQSIKALKKDEKKIQKVLKICCQQNDPATSKSLADSKIYTTSARHISLFVRTINPDFIDNEFLQRCANMAKEANQHTIKINFELLLADQERINSIGKSDIRYYRDQMEKTIREFKMHEKVISQDKSLCAEYYYQYGRYLTQKFKQTKHDRDKNQAREQLMKSLELRREQLEQSSESSDTSVEIADVVHSLLEVGNTYKNYDKNNKEAEKHFNEAIELSKQNLGEHELTAHCHKYLGDLFFTNTHEYYKAHKEYNDAKKMLENLGLHDTIRYVSVLKNLALVLNEKPPKAIEILENARDIAEKLAESHEARVCKAKIYVSLAELERGRKKSEAAKKALKFEDVLHPKDVGKMKKISR